MCDYCMKRKSLFWESDSKNNAIREVYIEQNDASMTVTTNLVDLEEYEENQKIGIEHKPLASCNFEIKYCPMCGEKLK